MLKVLNKKRLYNIALYYLERFDASEEKVKQVFKRRIYRAKLSGQEISPNIEKDIQEVIAQLKEQGYLNNNRYLENQIRLLQNAGKSMRFMIQKLKQDGFNEEEIFTQIQNAEITDLQQAKRLVQKRKLGIYRANAEEFYQKDLAVLARAGFPLEIAKQALKETD